MLERVAALRDAEAPKRIHSAPSLSSLVPTGITTEALPGGRHENFLLRPDSPVDSESGEVSERLRAGSLSSARGKSMGLTRRTLQYARRPRGIGRQGETTPAAASVAWMAWTLSFRRRSAADPKVGREA